MIHFFLYSWDNPHLNAFIVEEKQGGFVQQGGNKTHFSNKKNLWDYAKEHFSNENFVHYELKDKGFL